jgi:hypothetical protein
MVMSAILRASPFSGSDASIDIRNCIKKNNKNVTAEAKTIANPMLNNLIIIYSSAAI